MVGLNDIDPDGLSEPFEGEFPAGTWLRYDPVFNEVKRARTVESDYLPQGIWQRETKRANWSLSRDISYEVLNSRSKDLQFAAWLTEALSHLYGIEGTIKGVTLIETLTTKLWDELYPSIDDDEDFTSRLLIFEWLDRILPEAVDKINITSSGADLVNDFCLREWSDIKRKSRLDGSRQGSRKRRENQNYDENEVIEQFRAALLHTPEEYFVELGSHIEKLEEVLAGMTEIYSNICGPGSVRFPKLNNSLEQLKRCLYDTDQYLAQNAVGNKQTAKGVRSQQTTGSGPINSPPQNEILNEEERFDIVAECGNVTDKEMAYRILGVIAERMIELDPHSAAPYLAQKAASFKDCSFADLMVELVDDERTRNHIFKLMGIDMSGRAQSN